MDDYTKLWNELFEWIEQQSEESNDDIAQWIYTKVAYKMNDIEFEYYKNKPNSN